LTKTHNKEFREKVFPALKVYQEKHEPKCASLSRDPVLLSNTFNIDEYKACIAKQTQIETMKK